MCASNLVRVTVVHHAALGDTVLLIPLLRALRVRFGRDAMITVVTRESFGKLLVGLGHADSWASAENVAHAAWFGEMTEGAVPEWANADVLVSGVSTGQDAWAANARRMSSAALHFFEPRPPREYRGHVTAWHREQLAALELVEPALEAFLAKPDGGVVIHPGSGGEAKCWAVEKFLALGEQMRASGATPTFLLGEVERERWGREMIAQIERTFPTVRDEGLCELAERLSRARLYVGNDSGITHLAAAVGCSTVAIFGASDAVQWRPIGARVKVVQAERGLATLAVEEVWSGVREQMNNE